MIKHLTQNVSPMQTIFKNTFWLYLGQFLSKCIKYYFIIWIARFFGPHDYGVFNYTLYLLGLVFIFSDIGLGTLIIREYHARKNDPDFIGKVVTIKLALVSIVSLVSVGVYFFLKDPEIKQIYFLISALFILGTVKDFLLSFSRAHNRMEVDCITSIIDAALTSVIGVALVSYFHSLQGLAASYVLGSLSSLVFVFLLLRIKKYVIGPARVTISNIAHIVTFSFPFLFNAIVITLLSEISIIMLKVMKGSTEVGYYAADLKILQMIMLIPGPFIAALFPVLSRLREQRDDIRIILKKATALISALSIPISIGLSLLSYEFIIAMFDTAYLPSVQPLTYISLLIPILYLLVILDDALISLNHQVQNMKYTSLAAALNICLNLIFIPPFGMMGAVAGAIISQSLNLFLTLRLLRKVLGASFLDTSAHIRYGLASVPMALTVLALNSIHIPLIPIVCVGAATYSIMLACMKDPYMLKGLLLLRKSSIKR